MSRNDNISMSVIRRLPRYYRFLSELNEQHIDKISSTKLAEIMNVTASQVRQDLNCFGGFGQQGYGYNVQFLHDEIGNILGLNELHNLVVIGIGHLGQAIANYKNFEGLGFHIVGLFDVDPKLKGITVRGVEIQMLDQLPDFLKTHEIDIAALTLPRENAEATAKTLASYGVKGIWNFALVDLDMLDDVVVENVHLSDSLMQLSYNIMKNR